MLSQSNKKLHGSSYTPAQSCLDRWEDEGGAIYHEQIARKHYRESFLKQYNLNKLYKRKASLNTELKRLSSKISVCNTEIQTLKKQRVFINDQITRLQRALPSL